MSRRETRVLCEALVGLVALVLIGGCGDKLPIIAAQRAGSQCEVRLEVIATYRFNQALPQEIFPPWCLRSTQDGEVYCFAPHAEEGGDYKTMLWVVYYAPDDAFETVDPSDPALDCWQDRFAEWEEIWPDSDPLRSWEEHHSAW